MFLFYIFGDLIPNRYFLAMNRNAIFPLLHTRKSSVQQSGDTGGGMPAPGSHSDKNRGILLVKWKILRNLRFIRYEA